MEFSCPHQQQMQVTNFPLAPLSLGKYLATAITYNVHFQGIRNFYAIVREGKEYRNAKAAAPLQINCGKCIPFPAFSYSRTECKRNETLGLLVHFEFSPDRMSCANQPISTPNSKRAFFILPLLTTNAIPTLGVVGRVIELEWWVVRSLCIVHCIALNFCILLFCELHVADLRAFYPVQFSLESHWYLHIGFSAQPAQLPCLPTSLLPWWI